MPCQLQQVTKHPGDTATPARSIPPALRSMESHSVWHPAEGGSLPISFNKPKRALLQALLIKPLLSISILIPDGQTPPAASVQFPTLFSHPALFISSCFSFWYTKETAASIDLLHTFSTTRLTSRSPLLNFIGPFCSLISSSFPD